VCGTCRAVFLAHKHALRCDHPECPMITQRSETLLKLWIKDVEKRMGKR
jgi:hypothetical protein